MELEKIASALAKIVGEKNISTNIFERINYALDGLPYELEEEEVPSVVVRPNGTKEISEIMKFANKEKIPVLVRGSGTGLHGGSRPKKGQIILDTTRLDTLAVYRNEGYAETGSGIRCMLLNEKLAEFGYFFPVVPGSERVASLGGVLSVNSSGHSVDSALGKPANYILGLEVVLPTGDIIETGSKTLRQTAGPDLTRLFIGTEGQLGVVTKIRFRLVPKPTHFRRALVIFSDVRDAARCTMHLYEASAPYPLYLEVMDQRCSKISFEAVGLKDPSGVAYLIATSGDSEEEAERDLNEILEIAKQHKPKSIQVVSDEKLWEKIWSARQQILPILCQVGPSVSEICDPPLSRLAEAVDEIYSIKITTIPNVETYIYGHIGAPSFHPHFVMPVGLPKDVKKKLVKEIRQKVMQMNLKLEGSYGEQGIFPERKEFYIEKYGKISYDLLIRIKHAFDPDGILNPGKW